MQSLERWIASRVAFWASGFLAISLTLVVGSVLTATVAFAEHGWIRGEIKLNVRSGPGTQFRILTGVTTGDGLTIVERTEAWTKIRLEDGTEGWIPVGYLKPEPPPTVRLAQLENEVADLRKQLESTTAESNTFRKTNATLSESDGAQRAEIERLILDNTKLRAGARYPELVAGASILAAGMILGAMLHRSAANKRPQSRIRL